MTRKIARAAGWLLTALVLCTPVALGVGRYFLHMNVAAVLSGSMRPTYSPGDAVVTRPIPVSDIRPGMIVLAVPPGEGGTPYAHRVISVTNVDGTIRVRTKGDANPAPDAWTDTYTAPTAQQVVGVVPKFGFLLAGLQQTTSRPGLPFAAAGLLLTLAATSFVLLAVPARRVAVLSEA